jgi:hydroxymethylglutaryl-CoA lyase
MADADELLAALPQHEDASYIGLVMNMRGYERAVASKINEINCVVVASDTFNQKNQGVSTEQTMQTLSEMMKQNESVSLSAGVTIGAAFGCPFEGEIATANVVELVQRLVDMGFREIALADTIGVAGPSDVEKLIKAVRPVIGEAKIRCHFHNTRNTGVANAYVAVQNGVRIIDSSCGGVGGCPFAPAATGNVATEDVLYMLERMGMDTGVNTQKIIDIAHWLEGPLKTKLPGMVSRAGLFKPTGASGKE